MTDKNIFEDVIIEVNLEYGRRVPLRLQINQGGITFLARIKEREEPSQASLDLITVLDALLHELGIPDRSEKHIHRPDKVVFIFGR